MRIAIFGLGYVGTVTGACLGKEGHIVVGVDTNSDKVRAIKNGKSPIIEKALDRIVKATVRNGNFMATGSTREAMLATDMAMVCVGTPSLETGSLNIEHLRSVTRDIGNVLAGLDKFYTVIIRSTVLPGTTEGVLIPILEGASGKRLNKDFGVCVNPEFMREGNSLEDFYMPAKTIIGVFNKREAMLLRRLYRFAKAPFILTDIKTAEFSKYIDNIFHGLKISFANEIGDFAAKLGVEPVKAMELFCIDKVSNISTRYLKPGFAFGGSCLPKDIRAVLYKARMEDIEMPLVSSILKSNDIKITNTARVILKTGKKKIGMLGLSFKPGTDDLRESQLVNLAKILIGKGIKLKIYDKNVSMARLIGANKLYIDKEIPHISSLLCKSANEAIKGSEVIILGHGIKRFKDVVEKLREDQILLDLT